ncbi:hypothetical protein MMC30_000221 [Trapelia coarctata]|nr:hypothetical protein [Trapelia coarctata]
MANYSEGTIPFALRQGDTVALISPSSRLNNIFPDRLSRAQSALEALGFHVKTIFNDSQPAQFHAAVQQRCSEIHIAFADSSVRAIICTIGGVSANELLPNLDYELIRANPKIFCGYSDITLLHHAFFTQAGLRTFYGPGAITQLAEYPVPLKFTIDNFLHVLQDSAGKPVGPVPRSEVWTQEFLDWSKGLDTTRPRTMEPSKGWKWLRSGNAEGRIFGGCLPSILQLAGTKFWPSYDGKILFIELPDWVAPNEGMPLEQARSFVADLVNVGVMGVIKGLVVGRPFHYDENTWAKWEEMLLEQCGGTDFPILAGVDVGHTDPILTIPMDAMVRLDGESGEFTVLEAAVRPRK